MYRVELDAAVRRSVYVEGWSERAAARRFGLARETVRTMLRSRLPPGYRRQQPIRCPKLEAFTGVIDQAVRRLTYLDSAEALQDLAGLPSNRLEVLRGDLAGPPQGRGVSRRLS